MKLNDKKISCRQASLFYYDYIQDAGASIEPEIFGHIEKCAFCRREIERLKNVLLQPANEKIQQKNMQTASVLASHFHLANKKVNCEIMRRFLPSLAGLSFAIKIPTPITVHIDNCEQCKRDLDSIRKLKLTEEQLTCVGRMITSLMIEHGRESKFNSDLINSSELLDFDDETLAVLKRIIERPESGIITEYITTRDESEAAANQADTNWPVEVVVHNEKEMAERAGKRNIRQLVKPLIAVAAMIFVASWFFVGTFANAIQFDDVYKAIEKIQNICLTSTSSQASDTTQKVWISKALNAKLLYSAGRWILWDIRNNERKTRTESAQNLKIEKLNGAELINVIQTMDIPSGLLPFQSSSVLPDKYVWQPLAENQTGRQFSGTQVYDLIWSDQTANGTKVYHRWRAYIDKDTLLPKRVENWQKGPSGNYELKNWIDITYPQTSEVEGLISKIS